jgi:DNA polymerase-3 subunit epsilon
MRSEPFQATLDQGVPLEEVTFCAVDLETTGGSPVEGAITEIGAVKVRGGERLGTFQTLVDPRRPVPAYVTHLTGIDDRLLRGAPPIGAVLPSFQEFVRGAVFVAHHATFDLSFLNASLERDDREPIPGPVVCTAKLARRIVWPDVPNVRLATLAGYFRTRARPTHRALADAEACLEVLEGLLEAGRRLGLATLGDVIEACTARGRPHFGKIGLADDLPRAPGVYLFRDRAGQVLYVGKSKDVRSRVRSYFYGDARKHVQDLLGRVGSIQAIPTPGGELEALVVESRLIARYEPRYNRRGKGWRRSAYLKLDTAEAFPRLKVVRRARADGSWYLGPFGTSARARLAKEAIEDVVPLRTCTRPMSARTRSSPCVRADIGRCPAPCDGRIEPERYGELVREVLSSLSSPGGLLAALEARMERLAAAERFEEAADQRDRLRALAHALWSARQDAWIVGAGRLAIRTSDGAPVELLGGAVARPSEPPPDPLALPCPPERADELAALRSWLVRHPVRIEGCDVAPCEPVDGGACIARILRRLRRYDAAGREPDREMSRV